MEVNRVYQIEHNHTIYQGVLKEDMGSFLLFEIISVQLSRIYSKQMLFSIHANFTLIK